MDRGRCPRRHESEAQLIGPERSAPKTPAASDQTRGNAKATISHYQAISAPARKIGTRSLVCYTDFVVSYPRCWPKPARGGCSTLSLPESAALGRFERTATQP